MLRSLFFTLIFGAIGGSNEVPADGNNRTTRRISAVLRMRACDYLLADQSHELLHLPLHLFHPLAHLQNDGDA